MMKSTMVAFGTALGAVLAGAALAAASASAQATGQQTGATAAQPSPTTLRTHQPNISRQARNAIVALDTAVNENKSDEIPAALAAAQAAANSNDDRYAIALIQLKAAANAKDNAGVASALEAMLASGSVTEDEKFPIYFNLANTYDGLEQPGRAAHYYELALKQNPGSIDATAGLAESKVAQGQVAEGLALFQKGIELQSASGRPSETWLKRALSVAYNARMPEAIGLSRQWVRAYPTNEAWQNSLAIYQNLRELDEDRTLDLMRLKRATGVLNSSDYFRYADIAARRGNAGEAKAVLEQGFAANTISRSDPSFSELYTLATDRTKGDRESLPASPRADTNARQTLNVGDAYFGYGDYAKAAEFYRAALSRPGADPDLINLRIGMALAHQGDRAGATAALNAVGSAHADLAQYWLLYVNSKA
jgi:tetratricopeptide (TPR) repeat protein